MREQVERRVEELKAARDLFVAEANQRIAAFNGAIGELESLLKPAEEETAGEGTEPTTR